MNTFTDEELFEMRREAGREWARREAMCDAEEKEQEKMLEREARRMDEVALTGVWVTQKGRGRCVPIKQMSDEHLQSGIDWLKTGVHPSHMEVLQMMEDELEERHEEPESDPHEFIQRWEFEYNFNALLHEIEDLKEALQKVERKSMWEGD